MTESVLSGDEFIPAALKIKIEPDLRPSMISDRAAFWRFFLVSLVIHCTLLLPVQCVMINNSVAEPVITVELVAPTPDDAIKTDAGPMPGPMPKQMPATRPDHHAAMGLSEAAAPRNNPAMVLGGKLSGLAKTAPMSLVESPRQTDTPAASTSSGPEHPVLQTGAESGQASREASGQASVLAGKSTALHQPDTSFGRAQEGRAAYLALIRSLLEKNKQYPAKARNAGIEGTVLVRFTLDREGVIRQAEISTSSGSQLLDQAAMSFIKSAAGYPPFPESVEGNSMTIIVPITYKLAGAAR